MGITHHWKRPTELAEAAFANAILDLRKLIAAADLDIAGFDGTGLPILLSNHVVFNGPAPMSCEPFEIAQTEFDRRGRPEFYGHCKTQGLPYDMAVKAALIILAHHLGQSISVSSDTGDDDWAVARELVQGHLGFGGNFRLAQSLA